MTSTSDVLSPKIRFQPYGKHKHPNLGLRNDLVCAFGELLGTGMFLFLALGGSNFAAKVDQNPTAGQFLYIALSQGIALMSVAVLFVKISGSVFNPAISFALFLVGSIRFRRMIFEMVAQIVGAILGIYLLHAVTPFDINVATSLSDGTSRTQGLFIEALLTGYLCFTVLMLPMGGTDTNVTGPFVVGLTLIVLELVGAGLSGAGVNPVRVLCAEIVQNQWKSYDWIYYIGPFLGSGLAALFYSVVKFVEYDTERAERLKLSRGDSSVEINVEGDGHESREKNGTASYVQGDAHKMRDHEDIRGIDMV